MRWIVAKEASYKKSTTLSMLLGSEQAAFFLPVKYLSQFNLIIRFCPGKLGTKPNSLTRRWDIEQAWWDKSHSVLKSLAEEGQRPLNSTGYSA